MSSVDRDIMSSGISDQSSSGITSGVVSIAASGGAGVDDEGASGCFSLLFSGGGFGGCVDAIEDTKKV